MQCAIPFSDATHKPMVLLNFHRMNQSRLRVSNFMQGNIPFSDATQHPMVLLTIHRM